jgi:hypothetical protein
VSRLLLLNAPNNLPSDISQPFLLSELPTEFDVEEALCINISEEYFEILRIFGKNETVLNVARLRGHRSDSCAPQTPAARFSGTLEKFFGLKIFGQIAEFGSSRGICKVLVENHKAVERAITDWLAIESVRKGRKLAM